MRWLILQSAGEHRGQDGWAPNWFLRECLSLQDALVRHGQMCDVHGPGHAGWGGALGLDDYDCIVVAENYGLGWIPDLREARAVKFHWIIDLHVQGASPYAALSTQCDYVLHATRGLIGDYYDLVKKPEHVWFPNAVDDRYFCCRRYPERPRTQDLLFVGGRGSGERERVLAEMERSTQLRASYGVTGYDYIEALLRAKIGFNVPVAGDVNYRTMEVPALGACLLTKDDESLKDLGFSNGENCLVYGTAEEAISLSRWALRSGDWRPLAEKGRELVASRHTYFARAAELVALSRAAGRST